MKIFLKIFLLVFSLSGLHGMASADAAEKKVRSAPAFPAKAEWVNPPQSLKNIWKDKLTLVYFWDYTTINSIRELQTLERWASSYEPFGMRILMIHAPEFEFSKKKENVERAARRLRITNPIYLDNDNQLWDAYGARSWPTKYLVDSEGKIVETHIGEGEDISFETRIREELLKMDPSARLPAPAVITERDRFNIWDCGEMSAELYVGYKRANWWGIEIANHPGALPNETVDYRDDGRRLERGIFLHGEWTNREDYFEHTKKLSDWSAYIGGIYLGAEVYVVAASKLDAGREIQVFVRRDNQPVPSELRGVDLQIDETGETYFALEEPRLYYLIRNEDHEYHEIKLMTRDSGVAIYGFSFANICLTGFDHR